MYCIWLTLPPGNPPPEPAPEELLEPLTRILPERSRVVVWRRSEPPPGAPFAWVLLLAAFVLVLRPRRD